MTGEVETVNAAVDCPDWTRTCEETCALGVLLVRVMMSPAAGAGAASVTAPATLPSPTTSAGESAMVQAADSGTAAKSPTGSHVIVHLLCGPKVHVDDQGGQVIAGKGPVRENTEANQVFLL
jgi:hypothetical protein